MLVAEGAGPAGTVFSAVAEEVAGLFEPAWVTLIRYDEDVGTRPSLGHQLSGRQPLAPRRRQPCRPGSRHRAPRPRPQLHRHRGCCPARNVGRPSVAVGPRCPDHRRRQTLGRLLRRDSGARPQSVRHREAHRPLHRARSDSDRQQRGACLATSRTSKPACAESRHSSPRARALANCSPPSPGRLRTSSMYLSWPCSVTRLTGCSRWWPSPARRPSRSAAAGPSRTRAWPG